MSVYTPENLALIERKLLGQLTGEEARTFEQKLKDSEFQALYKAEQDLFQAFQSAGRAQLKADLQALDAQTFVSRSTNQVPDASGKVRPMFQKYAAWAVAAAVVLLLGLVYVLRPQSMSNEELLAAHFEPYPNEQYRIQRGAEDSTVSKSVLEAFYYYDSGDYEVAAEKFNFLNQKAGDQEIEFFEAISLMKINRWQEAIEILTSISEQSGSKYQKPADWYKALSLIGLNRTEDANTLIQVISTDNTHPFQQQAKALLEARK
ncbi:MAG: hypothetical protein AAGI38_00030 [Bacteroidota bacterium]